MRSALAAKQIWVAVITIWGTLDSLPRQGSKHIYKEVVSRGVFWNLSREGVTFFSRGGSASVGAWKPPETNRLHRFRGGLAPEYAPGRLLCIDINANQAVDQRQKLRLLPFLANFHILNQTKPNQVAKMKITKHFSTHLNSKQFNMGRISD